MSLHAANTSVNSVSAKLLWFNALFTSIYRTFVTLNTESHHHPRWLQCCCSLSLPVSTLVPHSSRGPHLAHPAAQYSAVQGEYVHEIMGYSSYIIIFFHYTRMEKDLCRGDCIYFTALCDHPYLVSLLFAVLVTRLVSLHPVTFLNVFCYLQLYFEAIYIKG